MGVDGSNKRKNEKKKKKKQNHGPNPTKTAPLTEHKKDKYRQTVPQHEKGEKVTKTSDLMPREKTVVRTHQGGSSSARRGGKKEGKTYSRRTTRITLISEEFPITIT